MVAFTVFAAGVCISAAQIAMKVDDFLKHNIISSCFGRHTPLGGPEACRQGPGTAWRGHELRGRGARLRALRGQAPQVGDGCYVFVREEVAAYLLQQAVFFLGHKVEGFLATFAGEGAHLPDAATGVTGSLRVWNVGEGESAESGS